MALGKTIQIFLPDGNPRGVKIAEITSRTVQAILIPRSKLGFATSRDELNNVGIYFLIGSPDEGSRPVLYVGEAEDCLTRLKHQNKSKDFWNIALVFVSKTKYFTKSHIKYLEWQSYTEAKEAARFAIENTTVPTRPFISESMQADLQDNFDTIKVLASTLGYPIFDQMRKPMQKEILVCRGKAAYAEGEYTEEGLIVFEGSKCNLKETKNARAWVIGIRQRLVKDGILTKEGETLKFAANHVFPSPSTAAAVVLGRSANGWTAWKYKSGKTLDQVQRQVGGPEGL